MGRLRLVTVFFLATFLLYLFLFLDPPASSKKQLLANGDRGPLNVGAVVILPEEFKLAPSSRIPSEVKAKNKEGSNKIILKKIFYSLWGS